MPAFRLLRSLSAVIGVAAIAALAVAGIFRRPSAIVVEFDRDLPARTRGFHGVERLGDQTFVWTSRTATLSFDHVDREVPWACVVTGRSARLPEQPVPRLSFAVDGIVVSSLDAPPGYADLSVALPPRPGRPGFTLAVSTSPTVTGGPADPRELGVMIDRLACAPDTSGRRASAPRTTITAAVVAGAAFGALAVWLGLGVPGLALAGAVSIAGAFTLSAGLGPYGPFATTALVLALVLAAASCAGAFVARAVRGASLSREASLALLLVAGVCWLKCLGLLHPDKAIVDAAFHAHRLQGVLAGNYFFTQPMPNGVSFPYAIGLYAVAAPFTWVVSDLVTLLRVVVVLAESLAALALYGLVVRLAGDHRAGLGATALYLLVPLPYIVLGNANLTFAFGQSMAVVALAAAAGWAHPRLGWGGVLGVTCLALVACLSHVAVFPTLACALLWLAFLAGVRRGANDLTTARRLVAATIVAAALAVVIYYGQFGEVYQSLWRVIARASGDSATAGASAAVVPADMVSRGARAAAALSLAWRDWGWPLVLLSAGGVLTLAGRLWTPIGRFSLALVATYALFVGASLATPIEAPFVRYAEEFLSRMNVFLTPVLAAWGGIALARAGGERAPFWLRVVAAGLMAAAIMSAGRAWWAWFR